MQLQTIAALSRRPAPTAQSSAEEIDIEVGRRLRIGRIRAGLSQQRLGELIGVTFQQVQKYENGRNRVSASRLVQIAHALDIRPADLLPTEPGDTSQEPSRGHLYAMRAVAAIQDPGHLSAVTQLAAALAGIEDKEVQA